MKKLQLEYMILFIVLFLGIAIGAASKRPEVEVEIWTVKNPERIPYCETVGRENPYDKDIREYCNN